MKVYIACDRANTLFSDSAVEARNNVTTALTLPEDSIELVYPSRGWGMSGGTMLAKVLQIMDSELVLIDMTPIQLTIGAENPQVVPKFNEDVMIEYGIVLALNNLRTNNIPIGSGILQTRRPAYRVFCATSFPRHNLPPIASAEDVESYNSDALQRGVLVSKLQRELGQNIGRTLNPERPPIPQPVAPFQPAPI